MLPDICAKMALYSIRESTQSDIAIKLFDAHRLRLLSA